MSADVHTVPPRMNLRELTDLVFQEKHRGYPVVDGGELLGMVTTADIQRIPESLRESMTVGDVMTKKIFGIGPDEEATAAMKKLTELVLRRLPIIENDRLMGILSREDLVRAMELCSGGVMRAKQSIWMSSSCSFSHPAELMFVQNVKSFTNLEVLALH